jgi:hypothetical protein
MLITDVEWQLTGNSYVWSQSEAEIGSLNLCVGWRQIFGELKPLGTGLITGDQAFDRASVTARLM